MTDTCDNRSLYERVLGIESRDQYIRRHRCQIAQINDADRRRNALRGPVGNSPPEHSGRTILIGRSGGQPVLFEYERRDRLQTLTWPNHRPRRNYYSVNDIVLLGEHTELFIGRIHPELQNSREVTLTDLALGFLGESPATYKIGEKILSISPEGASPGTGSIRTKGVIFFSGNAVELNHEFSYSAVQFGIKVREVRTANSLAAMIPILEALAQFAGDAASAGTGSLIRAGGRRIARYSLRQAARVTARRVIARRLLRLALSRSGRAMLGAGVAFVRGIGNEYRRRDAQNEMRRGAGARTLSMDDYRPYLVAGIQAMVESLLGNATESLSRSVRQQSSGNSAISQAIAAEALRLFLIEPIRVLMNAAYAAYQQTETNPDRFGQVFGEQIREKALDVLISAVRHNVGQGVDSAIESANATGGG